MFLLASITSVVSGSSPVIGWSNAAGTFAGASDVRAFAQVPVETVASVHLGQAVTSKNTVLFLQDQLSVDDFAKYADSSLAGVKASMASAADTLVLPSVVPDARSLEQTLAVRGTVVTAATADEAMAAIRAAGTKKVLITVQLSPVGGVSATKAEALAANGRLVQQIFAAVTEVDTDAVAVLTAAADSPASWGVQSLGHPDTVEVVGGGNAASDRTRRSEVTISKGSTKGNNRTAALNSRSCKYWPQQRRPDGSYTQQGGKTCKPGHQFGITQKQEIFSIATLEGITVMLLIVPMSIAGVYFLMGLQTNPIGSYPSVDDAPLIVSTANE